MIFIFPIAGETVSGTASRQYKLAWGKWRQAISRHFSPPRMPVSQSCTSATFNFSLRATSSHHLDSGRIGLLDTWTLQRCQGLVLFLYLSYLAVTLSTLTMQGGPDCRRVPLNRPKLWRLPGCRQDCLPHNTTGAQVASHEASSEPTASKCHDEQKSPGNRSKRSPLRQQISGCFLCGKSWFFVVFHGPAR